MISDTKFDDENPDMKSLKFRNQPESVPYDRSVRRFVTLVIWYE